MPENKLVHLHTHSHYSLLDGLAKIDDLLDRAEELGMKSLALTDHGNLHGAIEFYQKAKKRNIKPILGVEAYLAPGKKEDKNPNGTKYFHQLLIAENEDGWKNLLKLVSIANLEGFYYKPRIDIELLEKHHQGLIGTSSCLAGIIPQLILQNKEEEAFDTLKKFKNIFKEENFFLELQHHPNIEEQKQVNEHLKDFAKKSNTPLIATQDIHYASKEDSDYHDILLAVQTGNKVADTNRMTLKMDDFSMTSEQELQEHFKDTPEVFENTQKIADRCNVEITLGETKLPKFSLPEGFTDDYEYFDYLTRKMVKDRYDEITPEIQKRLDYELDIIKQTGYAGYFLIVQDFINWAKNRGIAVGPGRGSAAGSLVAYSLKITDIDPLEYDLLFERFLNPERIQMPDIDIDFADTRRDEVLGYVREKYGNDHVAQIITFGTMAARAAIRDSGRALGLSYGFCDQIAKLIPFNTKLKQAIKEVPELKSLYQTDPDAKKVLDAALHLEGVARHASVHACGTVIAPDALTEYVPIQRAPQDENTIVTQFEMHAVEDLGLLKMDFLGLKNLSIIENAVNLIKEYKNEDVDVSKLKLDDQKTYELLQDGDTTGVFQFESSGMRRYMKELKPTEFEDLIAMVALYRPGPMELIPTYINRKHGKEKVTYLHPMLEPILKNTYGVGVYQEQMMRIARDLGNFSLGEADMLRKAIGKKIEHLLAEQKVKLMKGMIENKIEEKVAKEIWELFPPFARYGFNRSHAACYALIGYRTAYLRAHYKTEFSTALLNADMNDIERLSFLISEAKKSGLTVHGPDINKSESLFTPEQDGIRFGMSAIKNVGHAIVEALVEERAKSGPFKNLTDLITRVDHKDLNKKSLESLIKAGAFDSLNIERGQALGNIDNIIGYIQSRRKNGNNGHQSLFGQTESINTLKLEPSEPASKKDTLSWEKELIGFYVSEHPLEHLQDKVKKFNIKPISFALNTKDEKLLFRIAGTITALKKHITKKGQPMMFVTIEDQNDSVEMLVFNEPITKKPDMWKENNVIILEGRMSQKGGDPKFIVNRAGEL